MDRDLLIANTGADRHEDWGGEFSSFQQPFAPHGNGHNERQVPPHTFEFFYALGESDGADQTRIGELEEGRFGDPERNGEPYGELGLIIQKDRDEGFNWKDQHGKPIDRQAGNTPGGKRDNRGDGLSGGTKNVEATTSATDVVEVTLEETMQLALGFWASKITGMQGVTFAFTPSLDLVSDGLALNEGTVLATFKIGKEYSWQVVPI